MPGPLSLISIRAASLCRWPWMLAWCTVLVRMVICPNLVPLKSEPHCSRYWASPVPPALSPSLLVASLDRSRSIASGGAGLRARPTVWLFQYLGRSSLLTGYGFCGPSRRSTRARKRSALLNNDLGVFIQRLIGSIFPNNCAAPLKPPKGFFISWAKPRTNSFAACCCACWFNSLAKTPLLVYLAHISTGNRVSRCRSSGLTVTKH